MRRECRVPVIVCGACGRMGALIVEMAAADRRFRVCGAVERRDHPVVGTEIRPGLVLSGNLAKSVTGREVIIDFSVADSAMDAVSVARRSGNPLVIGTTGFSAAQQRRIRDAGRSIAVLAAPNMSFGVNCFFEIVRRAAQMLRGYETEIVEIHHHHKKDAPSGTARKLAQVVCDVRRLDPVQVLKPGRCGITGQRPADEIGVHAVRVGDVVGEHTVLFGGRGEIIELSHRCYDRAAFASGALAAALFLHGRRPGLYTMEQVVGGLLKTRGSGKE